MWLTCYNSYSYLPPRFADASPKDFLNPFLKGTFGALNTQTIKQSDILYFGSSKYFSGVCV